MPEIIKSVLTAAGILGGMGLILGALLSVISKVFYVKEDPRLGEISDCLPAANCGGCGYAGCAAYAEAILKGEAPINLCHSGGQQTVDRIAQIMGVASSELERRFALVRCSGSDASAVQKYEYRGLSDCDAAMKLQSGPKACAFACLGFGNCAKVCRNNAISLNGGVATVDRALCGGCGECAKACPKHIIDIVPDKAVYAVACSSVNKGPVTKKNCGVGCIGCKLCEKNCPNDAIHVTDFLAKIDYEKCSGCGVCAQKCPSKIIVKVAGA